MALHSEYLEKLISEKSSVAHRYKEKIKIIGGIDPYCLKDDELHFEIDAIPKITPMDITSYFFLMSFYTFEQMKHYTNLTAYKHYKEGHIEKVGCRKIRSLVLMVGKIINQSVWIVCCSNGGGVLSVHCTCMSVDSGEVCDHIAAILYALQNAIEVKYPLPQQLKSWWKHWKLPSTFTEKIVEAPEVMDEDKTFPDPKHST